MQLGSLTEQDISGTELRYNDILTIGKIGNLAKLVMQGCVIKHEFHDDSLGGLEHLHNLRIVY